MATKEKLVAKASDNVAAISDSTISNLELFTCLWLDQNVNSTKDNRDTQRELRQVINHFRTFDNADACEQYIRKITQEKIILIVAGSLGRQVVPRLHDQPQLAACYVFCQDKKSSEQWASKFYKVSGIFVHRSELLAQVSRDQASRVKIESGPSISVLTRDLQAIESHNAVFMWFQLFIEVLLRMNHKASDRAELTAMCKRSYNGNNEQMNIIDEFERNYQPAEAIWWYTRESCFYRMLNKALRVQDFDMLFAFRFFISDIAELVKIEHEKFIRTSDFRNKIKVYRGQVIRKNEINLMKNSINEFLSMNTFLSTSRDRALALIFARINTNIGDDMQPVIFEIEIDPRLRTKAFADITQMSYFKGEDETLIMIGALFRIVKVFDDENERMCVVSLSLASEDDFDLKELFSHMKKKIGDNTGLDSLGKLLLRMGENEKARKCYERMLNETMLAVGDAQLGLGWTHLRCNNADESLEHFEEALKLREHVLGEDHAVVGETYSFLGEVHLENEDHDQALIELNKAIKIQEKTLPSNSLDLAATYASTGNAYTLMEKYDLALKYYEKTLKIRQTTLPSNHPQMAAIYKNIGWMYSCKQNYSEALTYYEKSLEISRKTLPPTHPSIIGTEENIRKLKTPTKN